MLIFNVVGGGVLAVSNNGSAGRFGFPSGKRRAATVRGWFSEGELVASTK